MVEGLVGFGFDVHLERRLAFVNANGDKSRHKKPPESNLSLSSSKTVAHARPQLNKYDLLVKRYLSSRRLQRLVQCDCCIGAI